MKLVLIALGALLANSLNIREEEHEGVVCRYRNQCPKGKYCCPRGSFLECFDRRARLMVVRWFSHDLIILKNL